MLRWWCLTSFPCSLYKINCYRMPVWRPLFLGKQDERTLDYIYLSSPAALSSFIVFKTTEFSFTSYVCSHDYCVGWNITFEAKTISCTPTFLLCIQACFLWHHWTMQLVAYLARFVFIRRCQLPVASFPEPFFALSLSPPFPLHSLDLVFIIRSFSREIWAIISKLPHAWSSLIVCFRNWKLLLRGIKGSP